jgi:hypothetical protein
LTAVLMITPGYSVSLVGIVGLKRLDLRQGGCYPLIKF